MSIVIIEELKELLERQGLSYQQVAERTGLDRTTVMRIMAGKVDNPGLLTIVDIAECVGYELTLRSGEETEGPEAPPPGSAEALLAEKDRRRWELTAAKDAQIAQLKSQAARWGRIAAALGIVLLLVLLWLIIDLRNPGIGFYRG